MIEEWRPVVGFPDYEVSSLGNVKRVTPSRRNHKPRTLKPWINNHGYSVIDLSHPDIKGTCKLLISRLVCEAFHGAPPSSLHHAAHGDGEPSHNYPDNLRWATRSENMEDSRKHGTMALGHRHGRTTKPHKNPRGERHGHAKLTEAQALEILAAPVYIGSGRALAKQYGISPAAICTLRSGKTWPHISKEYPNE